MVAATHTVCVREVGSSDEHAVERDCLKYEWDVTNPDTGEPETVTAYSMPARVAAEDVPIPYNAILEAEVIPSEKDILCAVHKVLES